MATPSLDLIPAMLFGVLIGALIPLFLPAYQVQPGVVVSGLITSATAVFVGGLLQRGLARRAALERIPLTYISNLADGIDRLTSECLESYIYQAALPSLVLFTEQNHEGLANLRRLSQETRLFLELLEETGGNEALKARLTRSYLGFKEHLTGDPRNIQLAIQASQEMKRTILAIHFHIGRNIDMLTERSPTHPQWHG